MAAPESSSAVPPSKGPSRVLLWALPLLVLAIFLAYQPVWTAGFIWDDDGHLTPGPLRSLWGLWIMWTLPGASQQYYPLLHSVFWVMNRLFGQDPTAYHLLNIGLHSVVVLLVFAVLRRLRVQAAWLAALIFGLHPVMVESVAWVSEIKNTLSAFFYLGAAWIYLRYDEERRPGDYLGAFLLYFCALLSKTTAASLPAALLVIFWWKRGKLDWRREVGPLLPFFAAGLITGLFTAWVERYDIGASGSEFQFTFVERGLIAGRALWFYAGKLIWPVDLIFVYPRWHVTSAEWGQFIWPVAAVMAGIALCMASRWRRGPLAGGLFFAGTLFPALGFFNIYPFRYSFVADHFQYLASLGLIVPFACGCCEAVRWRKVGGVLAIVLAAVLATLTFRQCRGYDDFVMLYTETVKKNPDAALAHINLGNLYTSAGQGAEAIRHYELALKLSPNDADAWQNLGVVHFAQGRLQEARIDYERALTLNPAHAFAHYGMGSIFSAEGNPRRAIGYFRQAVALRPVDFRHQLGLGKALLELGYAQAAAKPLRFACLLNPDDFEARRLLEQAEARVRTNRATP